MAGWRIGFAVGTPGRRSPRIHLLLDHLDRRCCGRAPARPRGGAAPPTRRRRRAPRGPISAAATSSSGALPARTPPEGSFYPWWHLPAGSRPERLLDRAPRRPSRPARASACAAAGWRACRWRSPTTTSPKLWRAWRRSRDYQRSPATARWRCDGQNPLCGQRGALAGVAVARHRGAAQRRAVVGAVRLLVEVASRRRATTALTVRWTRLLLRHREAPADVAEELARRVGEVAAVGGEALHALLGGDEHVAARLGERGIHVRCEIAIESAAVFQHFDPYTGSPTAVACRLRKC